MVTVIIFGSDRYKAFKESWKPWFFWMARKGLIALNNRKIFTLLRLVVEEVAKQ